jgi:hypothetical protein
MDFRMILSEFLNYDNVHKSKIFSTDSTGKKTLNSAIPPIVKELLKKCSIKNPIIEESDKYYFIILNNSSFSNDLSKITTNNYNITDMTFDKGKLTIVIMK